MLEGELPQEITPSGNISIEDPTWFENTDHKISDSDDEWLKSLVEAAMSRPEANIEDQSEKTDEKTNEAQEDQSEKTEEKTNEEHEDQSEKTEEKTNEEHEDQSEKIEEKTNEEQEETEEVEDTVRSGINRQPLLMNISVPSRHPNEGAVPDYLPGFVEQFGSIPPWGVFSSMRSVMPTIVHDNELYLVLDELRD